MASDVEIVIKGKNESGPAFAEAKAAEDQLKISTKSLGDEFTSTGVKQSVSKQILKDLVGGYQNADSIIMGFSNHIEQSGNFSEYLDAQLGKLKSDAKLLGDELNRTGSIDVFGKLRENQSATKSLEKLKSDLTTALKDGEQEAASGFGDGLSSMVSGLGATLTSSLWYALIPAAPFIGAALAVGILGGVATGGLATGIIGQLRDPSVKAAASTAGRDIMGALTADTTSFRKPLMDAFGEISGSISSLLGQIDFGTLAGEIKPLADGISGLIAALGPGINDAISASAPMMEALGQELPKIGEAISQALSEVASAGPQATEAIRWLVTVIAGLIVGTGGVVAGLTKMFGAMVFMADKMTLVEKTLLGWIPGLGGLANKAHDMTQEFEHGGDATQAFGRSLTAAGSNAALTSDDFAALNQQLSQVTQTADTTAGAMSDKLLGALVNSDDAVLKFNESLTNLADTLKQNKDALDIHSKAGQQDREAILQAVQANIKMYDTMIQTGSSAQDAARAYDQNTNALVKQMRQAGLTQSQIDGLIGKYAAIPDNVNTDIATNGLTDAITHLNTLIEQIYGIKDQTFNFTVAGHVTYSGVSPQNFYHGLATGGVTGAASGKTLGSGLTWVGEQGPELLSLPAGSTVRSNPDSMRMAGSGQGAGGYGGAPGRMTLEFGGNLDSEMANAFKYLFTRGKIKLRDSSGKLVTVS